MSDFANRLRGLRLKYYWNQSQLAKRAGVSTSLISSYEKSERFPSVDMLRKLSDIFCCTTDYLLGLEYEMKLSVDGLSDKQLHNKGCSNDIRMGGFLMSKIEQIRGEMVAAMKAKDKSKIMKELMPLVKGRADGKMVNALVSDFFE